jgi:hypothetical protein
MFEYNDEYDQDSRFFPILLIFRYESGFRTNPSSVKIMNNLAQVREVLHMLVVLVVQLPVPTTL